MPFDITKYDESTLYSIYPNYEARAKLLSSKILLSEEESALLINLKTMMSDIEEYSARKRSQGTTWSLISLFKLKGVNPTLILHFYPGSDSYYKYGSTATVNVEFSQEDLEYIIPNLYKEVPKIAGMLKFKLVPEFTDDELNTGDIYTVQMIA
jgi:hypothetical protein